MMRRPPVESLRHTSLRPDTRRPLKLVARPGAGEGVVVRQHLERAVGMAGEIASAHETEHSLEAAKEHSGRAEGQRRGVDSTMKPERREPDELRHRERKIGREIECAAIGDLRGCGSDCSFGDGVCVYDREGGRAATAQREDPPLHHYGHTRDELAIPRSIHHRWPHDCAPNALRALRLEHDALGFLFGPSVGVCVRQYWKGHRFIHRGQAIASVPVHRGAADVHEARARQRACRDYVARTLDVPCAKELPVGLRSDCCGRVKYYVACRCSARETVRIGELPLHEFRSELSKPGCAVRIAHERPNGDAALHETANEIRAEHPCRTGDQRTSHAENMQ